MCSICAAVQGMDETVNNGAQTLYLKVRQLFGFRRERLLADSSLLLQRFNVTTDRFSQTMVDNLTGLIVGAPYLGKREKCRSL